MTISEDRTYSVWTYCVKTEWLRESDGVPDMLLADNQTEAEARLICVRLERHTTGLTLEVRDANGDQTAAYGPLRHGLTVAEVPKPKSYVPRPRRRLGMRSE